MSQKEHINTPKDYEFIADKFTSSKMDFLIKEELIDGIQQIDIEHEKKM